MTFLIIFYTEPKLTINIVTKMTLTTLYVVGSYEKNVYDGLFYMFGYNKEVLKSVAFKESKFDSWTYNQYSDAYGLMQISKSTENEADKTKGKPDANLVLAVKVLKDKANTFALSKDEGDNNYFIYDHETNTTIGGTLDYSKISNENRWKFVLGAYNGGQTDILLAMVIADYLDLDPYSWETIRYIFKKNIYDSDFNNYMYQIQISVRPLGSAYFLPAFKNYGAAEENINYVSEITGSLDFNDMTPFSSLIDTYSGDINNNSPPTE